MSTIETDLEPAPARSPMVIAASAVLAGILAVACAIALTHLWHALVMSHDLGEASDATNLRLDGYFEFGLYERDLAPIVGGIVVVILIARLIPRLARGSSSARTTSLVLALLLSAGCLGAGWLWGSSAVIPNVLPEGASSVAFMSQFAAAQRADMPSWTDGLLAFGTFAIPVAAIVVAMLLLLPATNEYYAAMRRSGQY